MKKPSSKDKKRKSKRHFQNVDSSVEETHKRLEKLATDLLASKKRVKKLKQKRRNESKTPDLEDWASCNETSSSHEYSHEDQQDYAVCLKYN